MRDDGTGMFHSFRPDPDGASDGACDKFVESHHFDVFISPLPLREGVRGWVKLL